MQHVKLNADQSMIINTEAIPEKQIREIIKVLTNNTLQYLHYNLGNIICRTRIILTHYWHTIKRLLRHCYPRPTIIGPDFRLQEQL